MEDVEVKISKRNEVLARIAKDRTALKGHNDDNEDDNDGEERTSKLEPSNSMNIIVKKSIEKS